jgi:hypothetical protein
VVELGDRAHLDPRQRRLLSAAVALVDASVTSLPVAGLRYAARDSQPVGVGRSQQTAPAAHLVSARADTWLVGGLSLLVLAVVATLWPLSDAVPSIGQQLRNLALIAPTLALLINYPHFLASYRLAYWRRDAALRHSFALVAVPTALVIATALAFLTFDASVTIGSHRIDAFGSRLAGWLVGLMFLTVGWHYVKQSYGCMRVGARLRSYSVPAAHARVLRYALFPLWISVWARANATQGDFDYSGIRYGSLALPRWVVPATNLGIVFGAAAAVAILARLWRTNDRVPPALMVVPIAAMFAWWLPAAYNPTFFVLVPMFHSLQYLPFAAKVEHGRVAARVSGSHRVRRRLLLTGAAIAVAGWLAFEIGPNVADTAAGSSRSLGLLYFTAMIPVAINIHHYFIDHVIWRSDEPEVFSHLVAHSR